MHNNTKVIETLMETVSKFILDFAKKIPLIQINIINLKTTFDKNNIKNL